MSLVIKGLDQMDALDVAHFHFDAKITGTPILRWFELNNGDLDYLGQQFCGHAFVKMVGSWDLMTTLVRYPIMDANSTVPIELELTESDSGINILVRTFVPHAVKSLTISFE